MSANDILGVEASLALVARLRESVRAFAVREAAINRTGQACEADARREFETTRDRLDAKLADDVAAAEAFFQAETLRLEAVCERRRIRIPRAEKNSQKQALEQVEQTAGNRKYELQKILLREERAYPGDLAQTEATFEAFRSALAAERAVLVAHIAAAQRVFGGYPELLRLSSDVLDHMASAAPADQPPQLEPLHALLGHAGDVLDRFRQLRLPRFFRYFSRALLISLAIAVYSATCFFLLYFGYDRWTYGTAGGAAVATVAAILAFHLYGRQLSQPAAADITATLDAACRLYNACLKTGETYYRHMLAQKQAAFENQVDEIQRKWDAIAREAAEMRPHAQERIQQKMARALVTNRRLHRLQLEGLRAKHDADMARLRQAAEAGRQRLVAAHEARSAALQADVEAQWRTIAEEWKNQMHPIVAALDAARSATEQLCPGWQAAQWADWRPPRAFALAAAFAQLEIDIASLAGEMPHDPRLAFPGPGRFCQPLALVFPSQGSLLFETRGAGRAEAIATLNNVMLRLFLTVPPGKISFTLIDPVELGQSFAGVMHLTDYEEALVTSRIWTQPRQIEQKLTDLCDHMEKVIQMYLRNEYASLTEYNAKAGDIAERYHFLVVADFPANFSDVALNRLLSIAASGARCGVHVLMHWDRRLAVPQDFMPDTLRQNAVCICRRGDQFTLGDGVIDGVRLLLETPPDRARETDLLHRIGRSSINAYHVEVPFATVAPPGNAVWCSDTSDEIRVPIGRTGATRLQYLALGQGTRQHALIAGKTGSGKSNLLHVIITNLSLWYSPKQVEFYLIDFKKGVEFKCYATRRLPHARVVAIESDREFGLSVLQRLDGELKRRGELFRAAGVQDLAGYVKNGGTETLPRTLLIVDEFQEFFVEDDALAQAAALLLDRLVRQGRAFGMHILLGSQTLGGAYTVSRSTLGQMVVRMALECNEADSYLIMDDNNAAPRLLSRPGEAIYNDAAGREDGNSPFQVVWLPDEVRDAQLEGIRARADREPARFPDPIVFEGHALADVRENRELRDLLDASRIAPAPAARIWLGAPNSIKGPTEAVFRRQSGSHLILVGQQEEVALVMMSVALITLAAQYPRGAVRFVLLGGAQPGAPQQEFLELAKRAVPHEVISLDSRSLVDIMADLAAELDRRSSAGASEAAPTTYVFAHALQRHKRLRGADSLDYALAADQGADAGAQFNRLICEGGDLGFHVLATCDTYNNVCRCLSRKAQSEFEMRVLFQMSASDSANLIDSPQAANLGLCRALLHNEQQGSTEVFRPYALPNRDWLDGAARKLARLAGAGAKA